MASDNGGIGNTPSAPSGGTKLFNAGDDSGNSPVNLGLRGLQTFLSFVNLFIYIGISLFQARWKVGPSGLTVLGIMMNVEVRPYFRSFLKLTPLGQALLVGALFLAVPLLYENAKFLRGIQRGLRVVRTAFIIHAFQVRLLHNSRNLYHRMMAAYRLDLWSSWLSQQRSQHTLGAAKMQQGIPMLKSRDMSTPSDPSVETNVLEQPSFGSPSVSTILIAHRHPG